MKNGSSSQSMISSQKNKPKGIDSFNHMKKGAGDVIWPPLESLVLSCFMRDESYDGDVNYLLDCLRLKITTNPSFTEKNGCASMANFKNCDLLCSH